MRRIGAFVLVIGCATPASVPSEPPEGEQKANLTPGATPVDCPIPSYEVAADQDVTMSWSLLPASCDLDPRVLVSNLPMEAEAALEACANGTLYGAIETRPERIDDSNFDFVSEVVVLPADTLSLDGGADLVDITGGFGCIYQMLLLPSRDAVDTQVSL